MFDDTPDVIPEPLAQEQAQVQTVGDAENYQARNFASLREYNSRLERENAENRRLLQEMYSKVSASQQPAKKAFSDDDYVEGRHFNELQNKYQSLEQQVQASNQRAMRAELLAKYPDIDTVVTEENIAALAKEDPDTISEISKIPDHSSQAKVLYKMIKKQGIATKGASMADLFGNDKAKATSNATKPKTSSTVSPPSGASALGNVSMIGNNGNLSDEMKKVLWDRMKEAKRRMG